MKSAVNIITASGGLNVKATYLVAFYFTKSLLNYYERKITMLQMAKVSIKNTDVELLYDKALFINWLKECIDIYQKAQHLEYAKITVYEAYPLKIAFEINLDAVFHINNKNKFSNILIYIYWTDFKDYFSLDKDGCLDITAFRSEQQKMDFFKYLIKRIHSGYWCKDRVLEME